jgi:hypothetical protein
MIYVDPPYNTGKEFIYPDKFQDNLDTYLRHTGQKGDDGFKISSNTESSGRYHTNWLNMMYPRLKLATDTHRRFWQMAQVCVRLCVSSERSERVANFHALAWRNALSGQFKLD